MGKKKSAAIEHVDIAVILDRSGSMGVVQQATIDGLNQFVKEQREQPGTAAMTLVQFDTNPDVAVETVYEAKPLADVPDLTPLTYQPRGGTPLYDAIGRTVVRQKELAHSGKVVVVIVTDGAENSSREWNRQRIQDLIAEQRKAGWEFVFMGADQDAYQAGTSLGVAGANTFGYANNPMATSHAYSSLTRSTSGFRSGAQASMAMPPSAFPPNGVVPPVGSVTGVAPVQDPRLGQQSTAPLTRRSAGKNATHIPLGKR